MKRQQNIRSRSNPSQSTRKPKPAAAPIKRVNKQPKEKKHAAKGLFSTLGGLAGTALGGGPGAAIGSAAGSLLGDLFGWGDYEEVAPVNFPIHTNTTIGEVTPMATQIPLMHSGNGTCRIAKREYVGDINATPGFTNNYYKLTPTNTALFPWLSKIAINFEQYKFLGVTFGYRSLTANALGSTGDPSMGSVTICCEYDVNALPAISKVQANSMVFAVSCKPSESMLFPIECDPDLTPSQPLWTATNPRINGSTDDKRLETMGNVQFCTQGAPTAYLAGELWVTYDVLLIKPIVPQTPRVGVKEILTQVGGTITSPNVPNHSLGSLKIEVDDCDYPTLPPPLRRHA